MDRAVQTFDDLKAFQGMLSMTGIIFKTEEEDGEILVRVDALHGPSNGGLEGTSTTFTFNAEGKLVYVSSWGPALNTL